MRAPGCGLSTMLNRFGTTLRRSGALRYIEPELDSKCGLTAGTDTMPIDTDEALRELLESTKTIALVGASANPQRASHAVMHYMMDRGYRVIPVNPNETEILGQKVYASLKDIPDPVDMVDI